MKPEICEIHRKDLLRFLLLKTAAVRSGIKPGELLRVRHCYRSRNSEGFQFCLYRRDILEILCLDYSEVRIDAESSLVLFYHPSAMRAALSDAENLAVLKKCAYPETGDPDVLLAFLRDRFSREKIPHEVGVFLGYPAKDVVGFMEKLPRTPVHRGDWSVFGDARESVSRMNLYRRAEALAGRLLDACESIPLFFNHFQNVQL